MINNIVIFQCIGQAWYLAVDMQLFWLTPILLFPLWLWPALGIALCWVAVLASVIVVFSIAYVNHLSPGYLNRYLYKNKKTTVLVESTLHELIPIFL